MTDSDLVFSVTAPCRSARHRTAALVACVLLVTGAAACSAGGDGGGDGDARASDTTAEAPAPAPPFLTGRRDVTFVDPSRPTPEVPGRFPALPDRTLPTRIMYPAAGESGPEPALVDADGASLVDAPPLEGSYPLVVLAHGFNGRAEYLQGLADRISRRGYVVVVPTFPLSRAEVGFSPDVASQPGDVSFLIDQMSDLAEGDPLAGHVDVEHVAVGGHSLGAATTLGVAYNSCCVDERIDATIPISGGPLGYEGGDYEDMPPTPMLLAHGEADGTVPIAASDAVFEMASPPVWYLRTTTADHASVLLDVHGELLVDAIDAFLDAQLKGEPEALDAMGAEVEASGLGEWRTKLEGG